jgi:hypothetical protein
MTNPTTPGSHNHLHPPVRPHDAANPRREIDKVFGDEAPVIEGLPIEVGHGAKPVEWQLAQHLLRVLREDGADAARALFHKLRGAAGFNQRSLDAELVAVGFMASKTADAAKRLDEFQPGGTAN